MSSSMFNGNSISVSVSDDESDDVGKMKVRVRRKRKKTGLRIRNNLIGWIVRKLLKWWMVLLFLPAAGLLLFEASSIGRKPALVSDSQLSTHKKPSFHLERKTNSNLNRLDPTTRVIGGVRQSKFLSMDSCCTLWLVTNRLINHNQGL